MKHQAGREAQRITPVEERRNNKDFAAGLLLCCSDYKLTYTGCLCGAFQPPHKLNSSGDGCGWHTSLHGGWMPRHPFKHDILENGAGISNGL